MDVSGSLSSPDLHFSSFFYHHRQFTHSPPMVKSPCLCPAQGRPWVSELGGIIYAIKIALVLCPQVQVQRPSMDTGSMPLSSACFSSHWPALPGFWFQDLSSTQIDLKKRSRKGFLFIDRKADFLGPHIEQVEQSVVGPQPAPLPAGL